MKKRLFIAVLSATISIVCLGARAVAQQAAATDIFGGPGGNAFSDSQPAPGARVVEVRVRSGDYVDSVQLVYLLRDGRTVLGPRHGGDGGQLRVLQLDADEYLTGLSGRSGTYLDSIEFQTNKRTSPTFGGNGGRDDFRVDVPANAEVAGLVGRAGEYLDAVGLAVVPIRRGFFSGFGNAPQPGQTSVAGGPGGSEFVDPDIPEGASVVEVRVKGSEFIDSVQMIYTLPNGRPVEAARHGGDGGRAMSFRLAPGEYIVGLSGRSGKYVDSLRIHTNRRTSQVFGGNGGDHDFRIELPDGNQATGFMGRSGQYVDAVGLTYAPAMQRQFRDRRRGRQ